MGKNAADLLLPDVRRAVLVAMLLHPQKSWYLAALKRRIGCAPSHLHRELTALAEAGILTRRVEGRQVYFEADPVCPFLPELEALLRKLVGAPAVLEELLAPYRSRINAAFIHGSVARGQETSGSDIDLVIVGTVTMTELLSALKKAEKVLGRPVNPTIYPPTELARKYREGHHFVKSVFRDPHKIFLVGSQNVLAATTRGKPDSAISHQQGRTGRTARSSRSKA